jgi:hypothetical protein
VNLLRAFALTRVRYNLGREAFLKGCSRCSPEIQRQGDADTAQCQLYGDRLRQRQQWSDSLDRQFLVVTGSTLL